MKCTRCGAETEGTLYAWDVKHECRHAGTFARCAICDDHALSSPEVRLRAQSLRIRLAPGLDRGAIRGWLVVTPLPKPKVARRQDELGDACLVLPSTRGLYSLPRWISCSARRPRNPTYRARS
jgi:hypothetical protein